jgi:predicted phage replisome organizer
MGDVSWIKIKVDMFDDEKIKLLQALPEGDAILVIWVSLITLAGKSNSKGYLLINEDLPYTDEMLSTIFRKQISVIRLALSAFENFGMIERNSGAIFLVNFDKHQNLDRLNEIKEYNRIKQKEHRERLRLSSDMSKNFQNDSQENVIDMSLTSRLCQGIEEDIDIDKDKEKEKDISFAKKGDTLVNVKKVQKYDWNLIKDTYNRICKDLPEIRCIDDKRKSKINTLMNAFDKDKILPSASIYQRLEYVFNLADESDFLSSRKQMNTWCNFDWLISSVNAIKVIKGNYRNTCNGITEEKIKPNRSNKFNDYPQRSYSTQDYMEFEKKLINKTV